MSKTTKTYITASGLASLGKLKKRTCMCVYDFECERCATERLAKEWSDLSYEEREAVRDAMQAKIENEFKAQRENITYEISKLKADYNHWRTEIEADLKVVESAERKSDPNDVVQFVLGTNGATFDFYDMAKCIRNGDRAGITGKLIDVFLSFPADERRKRTEQYTRRKLNAFRFKGQAELLQYKLSCAEKERDDALECIPLNIKVVN